MISYTESQNSSTAPFSKPPSLSRNPLQITRPPTRRRLIGPRPSPIPAVSTCTTTMMMTIKPSIIIMHLHIRRAHNAIIRHDLLLRATRAHTPALSQAHHGMSTAAQVLKPNTTMASDSRGRFGAAMMRRQRIIKARPILSTAVTGKCIGCTAAAVVVGIAGVVGVVVFASAAAAEEVGEDGAEERAESGRAGRGDGEVGFDD